MSDYLTCKQLKELDKEFKTDPCSPLHHDNRCEDCMKKKKKD